MPRGYKHTHFPATHLPPIVPTPRGCDDVQHSMTLSLHHRCMSSRALHMLYKSMGNYHLGLFSPDTQQQRVWGQTWIEGIVISEFGK